MVQSVQRALRLLEQLDVGGAAGRTLTELCAGTGLKAPTAHNLLATLVELGYAVQEPSTRRYVVGERAVSLGTGRAAVARLKHAAAEPVRRLYEAVNETVILAVDVDDRRHSILSCEGDHELRVTATTGTDDHFYDTATGRVLLAWRTPQAVQAFAAQHGLPGEDWPAAATAAGLAQALAAIREAASADFVRPASHVRALAVPVQVRESRLPAALGLFYPTVRDRPGRREDLLQRLRVAATEIEATYERI